MEVGLSRDKRLFPPSLDETPDFPQRNEASTPESRSIH
jgi:hypothetical protein